MAGVVQFQLLDWIIFGINIVGAATSRLTTLLCAKCKKKKKDEEAEKAPSEPSPFPMSLSIVATLISAPFWMGVPAEIYYHGAMIAACLIAIPIAVPVMIHLFFERFYTLKLTSIYEYLEIRFSPLLRSVVTAMVVLVMLLCMSVFLYAPAIALTQVTGMSTGLALIIVAAMSIVFTFMRGEKSTTFADVNFLVNALLSIVLVIIKGCLDVGGGGNIFAIASEGGRLLFNDISGNPTTRYSWYTQVIGATPLIMVLLANQGVVQKLKELRTKKRMYITSYLAIVEAMIVLGLLLFAGLAMYARFAQCDPLSNGGVANADQLVIHYFMVGFAPFPGMPGFLVAIVFLATLRNMADGLYTAAELALSDAVKPLYRKICNNQLEGSCVTLVLRALLVLFALWVLGISCLVPYFSPGILQVTLSIVGAIGSPILALFLLGFFCRCVNNIGAVVGYCVSTFLMMWLTFGTFSAQTVKYLPLVNGECLMPTGNMTNSTDPVLTTTDFISTEIIATTPSSDIVSDDLSGIRAFYGISYMWYSLLGIIFTFIVAIPASLATGGNKCRQLDKRLRRKDYCTETGSSEEENVIFDTKSPSIANISEDEKISITDV